MVYKPEENDKFNFPKQKIDLLINKARIKSRIRTKIPDTLNRFPINKSKLLQAIILKIYEILFREQRAIDNTTLDILQEFSASHSETAEEINNIKNLFQSKLSEFEVNIRRLPQNQSGVSDKFADIYEKLSEFEVNIGKLPQNQSGVSDKLANTLSVIWEDFKDFSHILATDGSECNTKGGTKLATHENFSDLIHINLSYNDPDYIFKTLESALKQHSKFILVSEYLNSKNNMLSSTFFLEKYKELIDYAIVMPSEQGELLIKTNDMAKKLTKSIYSYSYKELESFYDTTYYLSDCGGYQAFKKDNTNLDDRLYTVQCLVDVKEGEQILDLGCGRGELTFALARSGANMLGIDYSSKSIEIAEKNFNNIYTNLHYENIDFFKLDSDLTFDKIVASDLVEHIDTDLFEKFMERIAKHLKPNGKFILHTFPNKYIYSYKYKRDRLKAKEIGLYLPENPRSFYESLTHINEQTPQSLKKTIKKYFNNYYVWTGDIDAPIGNLGKKPTKTELIKQRSIFAVASNSNIVKADILQSLTQNEIKDIEGIFLEITNYPAIMKKNSINAVQLKIRNNSGSPLKSIGDNPLRVAYHIKDMDGNYVVYDTQRTRLPSVIYSGKKFKNDYRQHQLNNNEHSIINEADVECIVKIPDYLGTAIIEITLVQEGLFWLDSVFKGFSKNITVEII
jgi:2-polyprenyl-3-methyl-5-hydroxy-6-metoxy-1,4-benzoquinol methylase